jgi:hypothetical protein
MVRAGLDRLEVATELRTKDNSPPPPPTPARLQLDEGEWAEELAVINRRRNVLERKMRNFVRFVLKATLPKNQSWSERVLGVLPQGRRESLRALSADVLMEKLMWPDLGSIILKNWENFEPIVGDRKRFEVASSLLNDRPDAHAKNIDLADIALQRRELTWLEERIDS